MLDIHDETVKRILGDDLNMRKVNFKWAPHALDSSHKALWVQVLREVLDFLESRTARSLSYVYTGDETWVHLDNPRAYM
jgi:hypothetical protein